jgi:LmbE family N-acetylglucosaminyl deacetylase
MESRVHGAAYGMMNLSLANKVGEPLSILCIGAHSDDIEIGCGATLLQFKKSGLKFKLCWVVLTAVGRRENEARSGAEKFGAGCDTDVVLKDFKDGFLPYSGTQVKDFFEELKGRVNPDLIFTHWHSDAHQDHRMVCELTWNTFRNHLILEYEIPKYDGDMGRPNVFVPLDESSSTQKVDNLHDVFETQRTKAWFAKGTFLGLMRLRGMESNSPSGYAEAFHAKKIVIG